MTIEKIVSRPLLLHPLLIMHEIPISYYIVAFTFNISPGTRLNAYHAKIDGESEESHGEIIAGDHGEEKHISARFC